MTPSHASLDSSRTARSSPVASGDPVLAYLEEARSLVAEELGAIIPHSTGPASLLYELMLDYPLRGGKALRPALCIATCRALGGHLESVLRTAAVLELYHNAFLIHDDVEDGSEKRRHEPTLHRLHGVPIAVNVGDGMLALAMEPLLDNIERVGLGRALRILRVVARMARESAEGQMIELDWVRRGDWTPSDRDYLRMVYKKTTWYTFLAPMLCGAVAAGATDVVLRRLARIATPLGLAFQIQDDVLNLVADESRYGKEIGGDLWEGKHTLVLIETLRRSAPDARERAVALLRRPRDGKSGEEVAWLHERVDDGGGIAYAREAAGVRAQRARRSLAWLLPELPPSIHRDFLAGIAEYVVERDR